MEQKILSHALNFIQIGSNMIKVPKKSFEMKTTPSRYLQYYPEPNAKENNTKNNS